MFAIMAAGNYARDSISIYSNIASKSQAVVRDSTNRASDIYI